MAGRVVRCPHCDAEFTLEPNSKAGAPPVHAGRPPEIPERDHREVR